MVLHRTNLEKGKWGKVALLWTIFLGFQVLYHLKNGFCQNYLKAWQCYLSSLPSVCNRKWNNRYIFSKLFQKRKNVFLPCILHKHELHSGTLKLYPHRHGIQLPWGSWKALREAYCTAESFQNSKVGMQAPLWLHLCREKHEQVIITWKTMPDKQQGSHYSTPCCHYFII